jgi:hypothetical protein
VSPGLVVTIVACSLAGLVVFAVAAAGAMMAAPLLLVAVPAAGIMAMATRARIGTRNTRPARATRPQTSYAAKVNPLTRPTGKSPWK